MPASPLSNSQDNVALGSFNEYMRLGLQHIARAELELALRAFTSALHICDSNPSLSLSDRRYLVLGNLGWTNRLFGRYSLARDFLEQSLCIKGQDTVTIESTQIFGELGLVYQHMGHDDAAKRAFADQYEAAKRLKFERGECRAIGNLGLVNYRLALRLFRELESSGRLDSDTGKGAEAKALLQLAIEQLTERLRLASHIQQVDTEGATTEEQRRRRIKQAVSWEIIGLCRLSLCYTQSAKVGTGETERDKMTQLSLESSLKAVELAKTLHDSSVIALAHFYRGRALLADGQRDQALNSFNVCVNGNPAPGVCTPAIALCREPSVEHKEYLHELVDAGADMDLVDEHGYSALDYAVFGGDTEAEKIVLEGLRRCTFKHDQNVDAKLEQRRLEARLRKGYREIFQEKLRPVLLTNDTKKMQTLRRAYSEALDADENMSCLFDRLKFIQYADFVQFGRLPRSSDRLERLYSPNREREGSETEATDEFIIFFSYRWINTDPLRVSPDDVNHTQYRRMLSAVEMFLKLHPSVSRERLCVWMVSSQSICNILYFC